MESAAKTCYIKLLKLIIAHKSYIDYCTQVLQGIKSCNYF